MKTGFLGQTKRLTALVLVAGVGASLWISQAVGHPWHQHSGKKPAAGLNVDQTPRTEPAPSLPKAQIQLPAPDQTGGPVPWSNKPILNDPQRFQIAIVTDRTGGHRPGIWMDAVRRLNWLRPEFVVSVGDLIEGYTKDENQVEKEWKEFLSFIDKLDMKFFFVAGNHDLTNPMMHKVWRKKFGKEWYSFDYKNVHFVCLNSEDPVNKLSEKQLAWLEKDLDEHKDSRWTLVFLHKPLWAFAERDLSAGNPDSTNFKKVEKLLSDRKHTVFAGHVHHYVQYDRNGQKYYSLATTGGGSNLRGDDYGEFDHIMWLTMEKDGPHLAVLKLEGIKPASIVTEKSIAQFRDFLAKTQIRVQPILIEDSAGFHEGTIRIAFHNQFTHDVTLKGNILGLPLKGLTVDPGSLELEAPAGKTVTKEIRVRFEEKIPFNYLSQTSMIATIKAKGTDRPLKAERTFPVVIDFKHQCAELAKAVTVDGKLDEWKDLPHQTGEKPRLAKATQKWMGPKDASLKFNCGHRDEKLYFAVDITDDRLQAGLDQLVIRIDGRPDHARPADGRLGRGVSQITVKIPDATGPATVSVSGYRTRTGIKPQAAFQKTETGGTLEVMLSQKLLGGSKRGSWKSFLCQMTFVDVDDLGSTTDDNETHLHWRGMGAANRYNTHYGYFSKEPVKP